MNIGGGIVLVAVGAVLAFAVEDPGGRVNLAVLGWILMATGGVVIRLDLLGFVPRRRAVSARPIAPAVEEWRVYDEQGAPLLVQAPVPAGETRSRRVRGRTKPVSGAARRWTGDGS